MGGKCILEAHLGSKCENEFIPFSNLPPVAMCASIREFYDVNRCLSIIVLNRTACGLSPLHPASIHVGERGGLRDLICEQNIL